jgi:hypothetical protein
VATGATAVTAASPQHCARAAGVVQGDCGASTSAAHSTDAMRREAPALDRDAKNVVMSLLSPRKKGASRLITRTQPASGSLRKNRRFLPDFWWPIR